MTTVRVMNIAIELWGALFCLVGVFTVVLFSKATKYLNKYFFVLFLSEAGSLVFDGIAGIARGRSGTWAWWGVHAGNFLGFTCSYLLMVAFTSFFVACINENAKRPCRWYLAGHIAGGIAIALVAITQFTGIIYYIDDANLYVRGELFWISQVIGILVTIGNLVVLFLHRYELRPQEVRLFLIYMVAPLLAMMVQTFIYGIAFLNITNTLMILILFLFYQHQFADMAYEKELELKDAEMRMMLSQLKPHFMFNSLTAIMGIPGNPKETKDAIKDFSSYLRGNLDNLKANETIPFSKELEHIEAYLNLEVLRFGDELKVEIDTETTDFYVPPLTIQMLVENAIKHGLRGKEGGGTVKLITRENDTAFEITVIDDGLGFDMNADKDTSRSHVGLDSVGSRIEKMCSGTFTIESQVGQGTTAKVVIPKTEE